MARRYGSLFSIGFLISVLLTSIFIPIAHAQLVGDSALTSPPTPGDGHEYLQMMGETVNPANGSVNFRLKFPVPRGRGLTLPFAVVYDSNALGLAPSSSPGFLTWTYGNTGALSTESWSSTVPLLSDTGIVFQSEQQGQPACYGATNYTFRDAMGGSHSLGLSAVISPSGIEACYEMSPLWNSNTTGGDDFVQATLGGAVGKGSEQIPNPGIGAVSIVDSEGTLYNFDTSGGWGSLVGNQQTPVAEGVPTSVEDRNGNVVKIIGSAVNGLSSIVDSTGRTALAFQSSGGNFLTSVTVTGISSPYTLSWNATGQSSGVKLNSVVLQEPDSGCGGGVPNYYNGGGLSAITLPNKQQYTFSYDPAYGLLSEIKFPTGGYISYVWGLNAQSADVSWTDSVGTANSCVYKYDRPAIVKRIVSYDGKTQAFEQDFSYTTTWATDGGCWGDYCWTNKTTTVTNKDLLAGTTSITVYSYGQTVPVQAPDTTSPNPPLITQAIPVEQSITYKTSAGAVLKTINKAYAGSQFYYYIDPAFVGYELQTLDDGSMSSVCYGWGSGHVLTDKQEWDFGTVTSPTFPCSGTGGNSGNPTRETKTTYQSLAATPIYPYAPSLLDRPASVSTYGNGTLQAQTQYLYDQTSVTGVTNLPTGTHDETNYGTSVNPPRGNATTVTRKCLTCTDAVATYTFDETGQALSMVDPDGNASGATPSQHTTTYSYADSYTDTHPTSSTNTYLTQITYPATSGISHVESFSYAYADGQLTASTDENQLQTTYSYNDSLRRITATNYPDGGQITKSYTDTPPTPSITTSKKINSTQTLTTVEVMDGMAHVTETQVTSDPQGTIYEDKAFNGMNLVSSVSNPYRKGTDPTTSIGTTTYSYDALSRKIQEAYPDGSVLTTAYCGPSTLVTDPTTRWRRSRSDALGRVVEVDEPDAPGATVASTGCPGSKDPIWVTSYTYDALNDLTNVLQNTSHQRTFTFDSLKRLLTSSNPETGQITYTYDPNGNVLTKEDARSITTTNQYDFLNRVTSTSYSNGDPTVTTAYDQSSCINLPSCANIGHRTQMSDGAGSELFAYQVDLANLRDVHQEKRTTNSSPNNITLTTTYYFDLASNLTSIVYPTGRTINYSYDAADRPIKAIDSSNGITYVTAPQSPVSGCLASAVCYTPQGTIYSESIGQSSSFTGFNLSETYTYRLQPSELKASSSAGNALDITYSFVDPVSQKNAGHVYGITNNLVSSRSQAFTYDQLNRISSAGTSATSGAYCWGYQYSFDPWGNLLSQVGWSPTYNSCTETTMAAVTANGNDQISGLTYDASGNTQSDGVNTYTWNAESELKTAAGVTYAYDGTGRRVAKVGSKLYWYGSGGEILAETDAAGNTQNEYVFFGGKRVAVLPAGSTPLYYEEDFLGSSRVIVQSNGTLCYDADFTPFGGERAYTSTCSQNYKFEGKERDAETQNDDFGARYYSWRIGRWLSSDWSGIPTPIPYANFTNPQTLNLYSMVADDPESFADLDGHSGWSWFGGRTPADFCAQSADEQAMNQDLHCSDHDSKISSTLSTTQAEANSQQSGQTQTAAAGTAAAEPTVLDKIDEEFNAVANSIADEMGSAASKALGLAGDALGVAGAVLLIPAPLNAGEDEQVAKRNTANSSAPEPAPAAGGAGKGKKPHGNTAGDQYAELYALNDKNGKFLKWGVSKNAATRYSAKELAGGGVQVVGRGKRSDMLWLERSLVESMPGSKNHEPWRGTVPGVN
jgi:RHS repeat-associated protein